MAAEAEGSGAFEASMNTVTAASADFANTLQRMAKAVFEAGLANVLVDILSGLGNVVKTITPLFQAAAWAIDWMIAPFKNVIVYAGKFLDVFLGDGQGVIFVLRFFAGVLIASVVPALLTYITTSANVIRTNIAQALSFLGVAEAAKKAKWSVRGLQIATGVGLAVAVAGYAAEKAMMAANGYVDSAITGRSSSSPSYGNYSSGNSYNVQQRISVTTGADPMQAAREVMKATTGALSN